jgi:hypothetical protein
VVVVLVDHPEPVEVDQHEGQRQPVALGRREVLRQALLERHGPQEVGAVVVDRAVAQLLDLGRGARVLEQAADPQRELLGGRVAVDEVEGAALEGARRRDRRARVAGVDDEQERDRARFAAQALELLELGRPALRQGVQDDQVEGFLGQRRAAGAEVGGLADPLVGEGLSREQDGETFPAVVTAQDRGGGIRGGAHRGRRPSRAGRAWRTG